MNEKEFLKLYKERRNLKSIREAKLKLDIFWEAVFRGLNKDGKVMIRDWGSFFIKEQKPRNLYDIENAQVRMVEGKSVVKFKARPRLINKVNNCLTDDEELG